MSNIACEIYLEYKNINNEEHYEGTEVVQFEKETC